MDMAWNARRTDREVQFVGQYDALPCVVRLAITREDDGQRFGRPSPVDSTQN